MLSFLLALFFGPQDEGDKLSRNVDRLKMEQVTYIKHTATTYFMLSFLLGLFFGPQDEGNKFPRNIDRLKMVQVTLIKHTATTYFMLIFFALLILWPSRRRRQVLPKRRPT
jgi:hypothetical protein